MKLMLKEYVQPFFSIVIPLYNKENYILKTLDSVFKQSFQNFEVIIINDGSTDKSVSLVEALANSKIRLLNQQNKGVSAARNLGLKRSEGEFVAFLDADDYWYPCHLDTLYKSIMAYPKEVIFCTNYKIEIATNVFKQTQFYELAGGNDEIHLITNYFRSSLLDDIAWTSAICVKKEVFTNKYLFDEQLSSGQDTDLWLRFGLNYNFVFSTKVTSIYKNNIKGSLSNMNFTLKRYSFTQKYKEEEKKDGDLKKYMDNNRFAIALQFKITKEKEKFKKAESEISHTNLNNYQRILLKLPTFLLLILLKVKNYLAINNYNFTIYR